MFLTAQKSPKMLLIFPIWYFTTFLPVTTTSEKGKHRLYSYFVPGYKDCPLVIFDPAVKVTVTESVTNYINTPTQMHTHIPTHTRAWNNVCCWLSFDRTKTSSYRQHHFFTIPHTSQVETILDKTSKISWRRHFLISLHISKGAADIVLTFFYQFITPKNKKTLQILEGFGKYGGSWKRTDDWTAHHYRWLQVFIFHKTVPLNVFSHLLLPSLKCILRLYK